MASREEYDKAKAAADAAKERRDQLTVEIHEAMEASGDKSLTRDIGPPWGEVRFVPNETVYGDVYDEDKLLEWLNDRALTDEWSAPKLRKKAVNDAVKRARAARTNPPPGVQERITRYVTPTIIKR